MNFIDQCSQLEEDVFDQIAALPVDFGVSRGSVTNCGSSNVSVFSRKWICCHEDVEFILEEFDFVVLDLETANYMLRHICEIARPSFILAIW